MPSSDDDGEVSRRRRIFSVLVVLLAVALAAGVTFYLPPDIRHLLVGQTVEHCPDSEFSCPSQQPGLLLLVLPLVIIIEHVFGEAPSHR